MVATETSTETRPPEAPVRAGWNLLRNGWRALTSMRIALVLLFLLALGALPGALRSGFARGQHRPLRPEWSRT